MAKITGILGICIVGKASEEGTLEPTDKCRGIRKFYKTNGLCSFYAEKGGILVGYETLD